MKSFKVIFKLLAVMGLMNFAVFSAQANCPAITEIISAFNKNSLPPKGWLLISYTGNEIDKNFRFAKASWNDIGGHMELDGNVACEYTNHNEANPGFLIVETTQTLPAPQGKNWRHLPTATKTAVCESDGDVGHCAF